MTDPELLTAWMGIAAASAIGAVGWIQAAKANRQLTKTHRLARRSLRVASSALRRSTDASHAADEARRVSARAHAQTRTQTRLPERPVPE